MRCYCLCLRQKKERERKKERGVLKEGKRRGREKGREGGREEERWRAAHPWKHTQAVAMGASSVELGD